jgi:hypothetical protein
MVEAQCNHAKRPLREPEISSQPPGVGMGSIPNLSPKCALRPEGSSQEAEPMAKKPRHARAHNTPGNQDDLNKDAQVNLVKIIELVPLARLKPWARNARTHSKKQIRQIAKSIETFGFTNPALIDAADMILAGHGRVEAAKLLGMDAIPCVRLEHMTQGQKRAYIIADNKLAENAGWDQDLLAQEFEALMGLDLGFDLTLTGFSFPEIDHVIASHAPRRRQIHRRPSPRSPPPWNNRRRSRTPRAREPSRRLSWLSSQKNRARRCKTS